MKKKRKMQSRTAIVKERTFFTASIKETVHAISYFINEDFMFVFSLHASPSVSHDKREKLNEK